MPRASRLLLISAFVFAAAASAHAAAASGHADETALLNAILVRYAQRHVTSSTTLVRKKSITPPDFSPDLDVIRRSGAPHDLVVKTRTQFPDEPLHLGDVPKPFVIVSDDDLRGVRTVAATGIGSYDWKRLDERYPNSGGIVELSEPAFNADRSIAVVYLQHSCGPACAEGELFCVVKTPEGWVVATELPMWMP